MKKIKVDLRFIYLFIPLLTMELCFHFIQFHNIDIFTIIRIILYTFILSNLVALPFYRCKSNKAYFIFGGIVLAFLSIYSFAELIFKNFMGDYYSIGTAGDGAGRIKQYALLFLSNGKPIYYLCFLGLLVYVLLLIFVKQKGHIDIRTSMIGTITAFLLLLPSINLGSGKKSILEVYGTFSNKDLIIEKLGISHFLFRDITALGFKVPEKIIEVENDPDDQIVETDYSRRIDDSNWHKLMNEETDSDMQTIDKYLLSKPITPKNEMTGYFEDYNFIYILVESMDYLAIDPVLTPTLYDMYTNSLSFYNHYTPLYSCATGESEYVSYTSLFPYTNVCTPNYTTDQTFPEALPNLFKNKGYETFGFHNWRDEFYERNTILKNMGVDEFYDIDALWQDKSIKHTNGWQSDEMLFEQVCKRIEQAQGKFFADVISSVMHFPYDESSYWGDYYIDQINEIHPQWSIDYKRYMSKSMNFDSGLRYLNDYLEEKSLADNTVICFYADHRPYWLDYDLVKDYTSWINNRYEDDGIYRSPFIFYNKNLKGEVNYNYCSTLDHVPTVANLFNLNYDPRLYMGKDIYSGDQPVIFTNGNWLNERGHYDVASDTFTPNENVPMPDEQYIDRTNGLVQNTIKLSYLIQDKYYFENRKSIIEVRP